MDRSRGRARRRPSAAFALQVGEVSALTSAHGLRGRLRMEELSRAKKGRKGAGQFGRDAGKGGLTLLSLFAKVLANLWSERRCHRAAHR